MDCNETLPEFWTLKKVAEYLHCSTRTLQRFAKSGDYDFVKVGKNTLVPTNVITQIIEDHTCHAPTQDQNLKSENKKTAQQYTKSYGTSEESADREARVRETCKRLRAS